MYIYFVLLSWEGGVIDHIVHTHGKIHHRWFFLQIIETFSLICTFPPSFNVFLFWFFAWNRDGCELRSNVPRARIFFFFQIVTDSDIKIDQIK